MNQFLLLNRIQIQNANAVSGFTWGFPAITHFLGFSHNLHRKVKNHSVYKDFLLSGCVVIAHSHHVHCYNGAGGINFSQNKTSHFIHGTTNAKLQTDPPVIEEGKMNMTVSLLIHFDGYFGNLKNELEGWIKNICLTQRLAGGTILKIHEVELIDLNEDSNLRILKRKLLPGFVLQDRSNSLVKHFEIIRHKNSNAELFDAWLDFSMLKQKARPKSDLIDSHLKKLSNDEKQSLNFERLLVHWEKHKEIPYQEDGVPLELKIYFDTLDEESNKKLLSQWRDYCEPNAKTDADWEYLAKPEKGYLVPIMTGYKAISEVYKNNQVSGVRDNETDVCFVESVHSIGEWQSVHRIKLKEGFKDSLWQYAPYEKHWYLCKQGLPLEEGKILEPLDDYA